MLLQRLRIESRHGSPINDYRIRDGQVEVRSLDRFGHAYPGPLSAWKALDESDIELHFALETVVSKWLDVRLNHPESSVMMLCHTGEIVPATAIYRVYHKAHRLPDEVTLLQGFSFPRCSRCSENVTFRMTGMAAPETGRRHPIVLHELPEMLESEPA